MGERGLRAPVGVESCDFGTEFVRERAHVGAVPGTVDFGLRSEPGLGGFGGDSRRIQAIDPAKLPPNAAAKRPQMRMRFEEGAVEVRSGDHEPVELLDVPLLYSLQRRRSASVEVVDENQEAEVNLFTSWPDREKL